MSNLFKSCIACVLLVAIASFNNCALFSSVTKESAKSSAVIPTAFAMASCCNTFNFEKSLKSPTLADISDVSVSKSPVKAASLALSKFNCFPVSNSASNSADMEDSKSNNCFPADATCSNSKPKALACVTALAIASGLAPNWALIWPVTLLESSKTVFKLIWAPVWAFIAFTAFSCVFAASSKLIPNLAASPANCDVASADITWASNILVAPINISLLNIAAVWNSLFKALFAFNIVSVVTLKSLAENAAPDSSNLNAVAWTALIPKSFDIPVTDLLASKTAFATAANAVWPNFADPAIDSKSPFIRLDKNPDLSNLSNCSPRLSDISSKNPFDSCLWSFWSSSSWSTLISSPMVSWTCFVNLFWAFSDNKVLLSICCVRNFSLTSKLFLFCWISFWTFWPLLILSWSSILPSKPLDIFFIAPNMSLS